MKFKLPHTIFVAIFILILGMAWMTYYQEKLVVEHSRSPDAVIVGKVITTQPLAGCIVTREIVHIPDTSRRKELFITICPNASTSSTWKSGKNSTTTSNFTNN